MKKKTPNIICIGYKLQNTRVKNDEFGGWAGHTVRIETEIILNYPVRNVVLFAVLVTDRSILTCTIECVYLVIFV